MSLHDTLADATRASNRRRAIVTAGICLVVLGALAGLLKMGVGRVREQAARVDSI